MTLRIGGGRKTSFFARNGPEEEAQPAAGGVGAETCVVSLKKVLTHCGFEVIDMAAVRRQNLAIKLKHLQSIGEWLYDYIETGEWERVIPQPKRIR